MTNQRDRGEQPKKAPRTPRQKSHAASSRPRKAPPVPPVAEQEAEAEPAARGFIDPDFAEVEGSVDSDIERC